MFERSWFYREKVILGLYYFYEKNKRDQTKKHFIVPLDIYCTIVAVLVLRVVILLECRSTIVCKMSTINSTSTAIVVMHSTIIYYR